MRQTAVSISKNTLISVSASGSFIGKYKVVSVLKDEGETKVIQAIYFKNLWFRKCIIKTARTTKHDRSTDTVCKRLAWQFKLHRELAGNLPIAEGIEAFEIEEKYYIALKYITGEDLQTAIDLRYSGQLFKNLGPRKSELLEWTIQAVQIIKRLHESGFVHRDISASNFIISKGKLYLIDLEQCWSFSDKTGIVFPAWTKGYSSPQQIRNAIPSVADDIYSLGCLVINLLTGVHPKTLNLKDLNHTVRVLSPHFKYADLLDLVLRCLNPVAKGRPDIAEIEMCLSNYREAMRNI